VAPQVTVRWFAAAGEAAGRSEEVVEIAGATTTAQLLDRAVAERGDGLARVLAVCSVLVDGAVDRDRSRVLAPGGTVDVLPPFAGG
jgi:molybdopterin synthase sulfur carrier subunit